VFLTNKDEDDDDDDDGSALKEFLKSVNIWRRQG